jgi:hypothetical protein
MKSVTPYDSEFYRRIQAGALTSARTVVPALMDLLKPASVVDIGCGAGAWLSVVRECGIADILGIDGDYVQPEALLIPRNCFRAANLTAGLDVGRRFDLVLSLEVAEHIPPEQAETYLDNLTRLGDAIVFSAAIPNQTGTGHVNEQWPEYWKERFEQRGYHVVDCLRRRFWSNRDVERWYRQNILLYVTTDYLRSHPVLQKEQERSAGSALAIVHPAMYAAPSLSALLHMLPGTLARGLRRRWGKPA